MAATVHKLGPGTLTIGEQTGLRDFTSHTSKTEIKPEITEEEPVPLLSGESYHEEGEWSGELSGEFLQEYSTDSIAAWTWSNAGKVLPFVFVPKTGTIRVTGKCRITPTKLGGDVKKANTAEFSFKLTEEPQIAEDSTGGAGEGGEA